MSGRLVAKMPAEMEWADLWHTHVDWRGEGNTNPDLRREGLKALFAAWPQVEARGGAFPRPWQSWLIIDPEDSGQDAVYLHTPNPNRDNFPFAFDGVTWGVAPPVWLAEFIDGRLEVGRSEFEGVTLYWVRRISDVAGG